MNQSVKNPRHPWLLVCIVLMCASSAMAQSTQIRLKLADGSYITVDDAWESPQGIWYRQGSLNHLLAKEKVKKIERTSATPTPSPAASTDDDDHFEASEVVARTPSNNGVYDQQAWIYLKGGARVEADSASQSPAGVWYKRGSMSIFIDASRVDRIEVEDPATVTAQAGKKASGWSTGRAGLDSLIRQNGNKYNVDPYLIFLVMEQESHFNTGAVSPKGARGLMQLMPGTAARFGVRRAHDAAQNISGGTRYLRELLNRFNNRVDLVLASYNAGEGAVAKFGNKVPPYKETRNYVKKISYRYKRNIARTKKPTTTTVAKDSGER